MSKYFIFMQRNAVSLKFVKLVKLVFHSLRSRLMFNFDVIKEQRCYSLLYQIITEWLAVNGFVLSKGSIVQMRIFVVRVPVYFFFSILK